jgi:hypothetical protein
VLIAAAAPSVAEQLPLIEELKKYQLAGGVEPAEPGMPRFAMVISSNDLPSKDGEALPEIVKLVDRLTRFRVVVEPSL